MYSIIEVNLTNCWMTIKICHDLCLKIISNFFFFFHFSFRICLFRNQEVSLVNFMEIIKIGMCPWKNKEIFRWSILSKGNYYSCPVSLSSVKNPFTWICFSSLFSFQRHFAREGVYPKTVSQFCLLQHSTVVWHISLFFDA